jgi:hypothetical protein
MALSKHAAIEKKVSRKKSCIPRHHRALKSLGNGARDSPARVELEATDAQHRPSASSARASISEGPHIHKWMSEGIQRRPCARSILSTISASAAICLDLEYHLRKRINTSIIPVPPPLQIHLCFAANEILTPVGQSVDVQHLSGDASCVTHTCIVDHR